VDPSQTSPPAAPTGNAALAAQAAPGHFDELRGRVRAAGAADAPALAPHWQAFLDELGPQGLASLDARLAHLQRQIRDNGVSYNVYADADGPQRPWALDLLPMIIPPADWVQIEAGVRQRAQLLDAVMADVYGPQTLTRQALLPEALVRGHPGYLRPMHGARPADGVHLHIAAFDLARGPDGRWWVVSQRTQAPSGLGYLLENRITVSRQFPEAFESMQVRRLAASYKAWIDALKSACPTLDGEHAGSDKRIVLLTPGPYNETYFEHAYLARYLGLSLVEGSDLLVRDERLYLKTIQGLEPVHGVLKRLDDEFLDPLELRADSTLGVPGLLQVLRAGKVLMANQPGSAFLESPALLGFLPALSEHLLGQKLSLPSLATWWCGEQAALQAMLPQLRECVIKPTYPDGLIEPVIARLLPRARLDEWTGRILRRGEEHTVQAYMPLSQTPTWQGQALQPRSALLRVFALADGRGGWQVLPGGLARLAGRHDNIASMQHGGSSADVWVLGRSRQEVQADTLERQTQPPIGRKPAVSSRSAENLFWLGRYTERADNTVRLAQISLQALAGEDQDNPALLAWLSTLAADNALVLPDVPPATQSRRVFERALIANLGDTSLAPSVGFNLRAMRQAASGVRERLSLGHWQAVVQAEADFLTRCGQFGRPAAQGQTGREHSLSEALRALDAASQSLAALTGAQTDRMVRDDGWRLLSTGRLIERLHMLSHALGSGLGSGALRQDAGFRALLALFDSTITFQAQYQQRRDLAALLDLLVLDADNPRALAWVVQTLRARLARLAPGSGGQHVRQSLPDPAAWDLGALCRASLHGPVDEAALAQALAQIGRSALTLSDRVGRHFFSHASADRVSMGA
jgi:uncharacterized circularly permuted ATP-grasp superfamily protein/uncharacterized alpha-E superfamily protein